MGNATTLKARAVKAGGDTVIGVDRTGTSSWIYLCIDSEATQSLTGSQH